MGDEGQRPSDEQAARSCWADLGGPVHYVDYGGPAGAPLLVCLHGLGSSLVTWDGVAPALSRTNRVLAIDLAGFGRSRSSGLSASLPGNQAILNRFLQQVAKQPAVLVGHSMGGTIAVMQASRNPETAAGLVLMSPVVPWLRDEVEKRLGGAFAAVSRAIKPDGAPGPGVGAVPERAQGSLNRLGLARESQFSARLIRQYLATARERGWPRSPSLDLVTAGRSLTWTLLRRSQFTDMLSGVRSPVLWLHGAQDPFVPVRVARDAVLSRPTWSLEVADGVGHEPHWEDPAWTVERIEDWLISQPVVADGTRTTEQPDAPPGRNNSD
jgi:pimeloyl-ACP methyl ester carboxylesterase